MKIISNLTRKSNIHKLILRISHTTYHILMINDPSNIKYYNVSKTKNLNVLIKYCTLYKY